MGSFSAEPDIGDIHHGIGGRLNVDRPGPRGYGGADCLRIGGVRQFQSQYGLTVDGIVGRGTWNAIVDAYYSTLNSLPDEYRSYSSLLYPGYTLTTGTSGNVVTQIQTFLRVIAQNNKAVPLITVDGIFGPATQKAVYDFQRNFGLPPTGRVDQQTWFRLYDEYRSAASSLSAEIPTSPTEIERAIRAGRFPGTNLTYQE